MALLDDTTNIATKTELALFTVPPTQVAIEKGTWETVQLSNACNNTGPYEFRIPPDVHMLDVQNNYIKMQLRIVDAAGNVIPAGTAAVPHPSVAPCNLIGKTFFKNLRVFIGGHVVYDANNMYSFRSFLETELCYGSEAKSTHIQAALYQRDTPGIIDSVANEGFVSRANMFKQSLWIELVAPLHCDLFAQEKYLPTNIDLRVELTRNPDAFALMCFDANAAFKLEVQNMTWHVRKIQVTSSLGIAHEKIMMRNPAKYPIRRVQLTSLLIDEGRRTAPHNNLFTGQIPLRIIVGMVDSDAYHGAMGKSPFHFKHYTLTQASVTAGGQMYPPTALQCDFASGHYIHAFHSFFQALNMVGENRGNGITRESYANGSCFLAFDLSPDCNDGAHWELVKEGTTSLNLTFKDAIPKPGVEVIIYAEYDSMILIDRNRQPSFDYSTA